MVDAGSASAHRGWRPSPSDLNTILDVLEHFVREAFVAPARKKKFNDEAAKVKKTVPPKALEARVAPPLVSYTGGPIDGKPEVPSMIPAASEV